MHSYHRLAVCARLFARAWVMMGAALAQQLPRQPRCGLALFGYGSTLLLSLLTLVLPTFSYAVGWPLLLLMIVLRRATPAPRIERAWCTSRRGERAPLSARPGARCITNALFIHNICPIH